MQKIISATIVFLILLSSTAFSANPKQNFIVAKVDNKAIAHSELMDRYQFVVKASKMRVRNEIEKELLLNQILDKMVEEELIRKEANNLKVSTSPDEIDDAINEISAKQNKSVKAFKRFFKRYGISYDNYLKQVESEILWSKIVSGVLKPRVKVTEVEVRELFEQKEYDVQVKNFRIAEIFIAKTRANAAKLAEKLLLELKEGANFNEIVQQFSDGYTSNHHGEIGWVTSGEISPQIRAAIHNLKKGHYSKVVLLSDGYHIFKILDMKSETKIPQQDFETARNIIMSRKLQIKAKGYLMDLRKKSFIDIAYP